VALVLAVGGVYKLRDPAPAASMLASLGLPASPVLARASGAVELVVGVGAVALGGRLAAAVVALLYLLFAAMTARLMSAGDASVSCGCFGRLSAPPSSLHVVANLVAAAVALAAAIVDVPGIAALSDEPATEAATFGALVLLGTWLFVMVITVLPDTLGAARRTPATSAVREFALARTAFDDAASARGGRA